MANAKRDGNSVPSIIAVLDSDGLTITQLQADPSNHSLKVDDNTTGSDNGPVNAKHDGNHTSTLMALSNADGITKVPLYANSNNELLIDSN